MLTPEQRAEGRRLLAACNNVPDYEDFNDRYYDATDWLFKHADALLAEPPDVEAVKRDAVREFAESLRISFRCRAKICRNAELPKEQKFWELHAQRQLSEVCERKGIKL